LRWGRIALPAKKQRRTTALKPRQRGPSSGSKRRRKLIPIRIDLLGAFHRFNLVGCRTDFEKKKGIDASRPRRPNLLLLLLLDIATER